MEWPRNIPGDGPILFSDIQFVHHAYRKCKVEVAAARLDEYKRCHASPAVLSEERIQHFCTSLEAHGSAPLFTAVMRDKDYDPLLAVSPSVSSMSSSVVMTSSDIPSSSSQTTPQPTSITSSLSPEDGVWNKIIGIQEQAAEIERKTRYQYKCFHGMRSSAVELHLLSLGKSAGVFPVHQRITYEFYFESAYVPIDTTVLCLGNGQEYKALNAYNNSGMREGTPVLK